MGRRKPRKVGEPSEPDTHQAAGPSTSQQGGGDAPGQQQHQQRRPPHQDRPRQPHHGGGDVPQWRQPDEGRQQQPQQQRQWQQQWRDRRPQGSQQQQSLPQQQQSLPQQQQSLPQQQQSLPQQQQQHHPSQPQQQSSYQQSQQASRVQQQEPPVRQLQAWTIPRQQPPAAAQHSQQTWGKQSEQRPTPAQHPQQTRVTQQQQQPEQTTEIKQQQQQPQPSQTQRYEQPRGRRGPPQQPPAAQYSQQAWGKQSEQRPTPAQHPQQTRVTQQQQQPEQTTEIKQQQQQPQPSQTQRYEQPRGRRGPPQQQRQPDTGRYEQQAQSQQKQQQQELQQQPVKQTSSIPEIPKQLSKAEPTVAVKPKAAKDDVLALPLAQRAEVNSCGKVGKPIQITANYFSLQLGKLEKALHYDVAIDPDKPKKELRRVMEEFRRKHYPNRYPAFDGAKNLYSSSRLPFGEKFTDENIIINIDGRDKTYKVTVKFATYVDLSSLRSYFSSRTTKDHLISPQDAIQCIDIVLRSAPAVTCISAGKSFFTKPEQFLDLGDGMEMYYGFYQSAILCWKPFLNVDVAHKAFPISQPVTALIQTLYNCPLENPSVQWEILENYIKTLKIRYEIPGQPTSVKVYRVNGLGRSPIEEIFNVEGKGQISIFDYFRKEKQFSLRYPKLPCLWVGSRDRKPRILLPAELCTIIEGQDIKRKMNELQTSKMIRYAATNTNVRKRKIMDSVSSANYNTNPTIREFDLSVGREFEKVNARILPPPALQYKDDIVTPAKGVWNARESKFISGATLNKWTIGCTDFRTHQGIFDRLVGMIISQANRLGMSVSPPQKPFEVLKPRGRQFQDDICNYFKKRLDFDLIIMIIRDSGPDYAYVKQAAELTVGCLTQCVKSKTVNRVLNPSTVNNILLKINAKLNGLNHCLYQRPKCLDRPCMIMGADVTHPSPEAKNMPSVAAVTASHDPKAFKYNICWRLQEPRLEIIEDLENIVYNQLMYFYKQNRQLKPEHIIFFRDGVSEGQFKMVMNCEVQAIRRACAKIEADSYKPKITFLVVQKRHHTRFFPVDPRDSHDKNFNVPAGTCVDTLITHPTAQDFYLVSHASIQGVAKPTKYRTLWDDDDMTEDQIEQLTYFLCHMFTRCNRSVSYPAPTYYAHLAAARAKVYCEQKQLNMNNLAAEQRRMQIQDVIVNQKPMFFV